MIVKEASEYKCTLHPPDSTPAFNDKPQTEKLQINSHQASSVTHCSKFFDIVKWFARDIFLLGRGSVVLFGFHWVDKKEVCNNFWNFVGLSDRYMLKKWRIESDKMYQWCFNGIFIGSKLTFAISILPDQLFVWCFIFNIFEDQY